MFRVTLLLLSGLMLAACNSMLPAIPATNRPQAVMEPTLSISPQPNSNNTHTPEPNDESQTRGKVYIDSIQVLPQKNSPAQISLIIKGNLPTPCHQLRSTVDTPDAQNKIAIEIYSIAAPRMCAQVLQPFEVNIPFRQFAGLDITPFGQ